MNTLSFDRKKVWVAGHNGLVGRALVRRLAQENCEILTISKASLDLRDQKATYQWVELNRPDIVFLAAAKVGGIWANQTFQADFLYDNLMIQTNVIKAAFDANVQKLVMLGSSCIYPRLASQPLSEDALLTDTLEPTNEGYAVAKIAGVKLCEMYARQYDAPFISAMPCNLYGPFDDFDLETSHVIPALIRKFDDAKQSNQNIVELWGTGKPLREFMYVDDLADGLVFLAETYNDLEHINIGTGDEISIFDLATMIADITGFQGQVTFDPERADGSPRKILDSSKLAGLGWAAKTQLYEGIQKTYDWYCNEYTRKQAA